MFGLIGIFVKRRKVITLEALATVVSATR